MSIELGHFSAQLSLIEVCWLAPSVLGFILIADMQCLLVPDGTYGLSMPRYLLVSLLIADLVVVMAVPVRLMRL